MAQLLGMKPWELEEAPEYWIRRMMKWVDVKARKQSRERGIG